MKFGVLKYRLCLKWAMVALVSAVSLVTALILRFDLNPAEILPPHRLVVPLILLVAARWISFAYFGAYRAAWRHFAFSELLLLGRAQIGSSVLFAGIVLLLRVPEFPRSIIFIEMLCSSLYLIGLGVVLRKWTEGVDRRRFRYEGAPREVVVIGAGASGRFVVKSLLTDPRGSLRPVSLIDDDPALKATTVQGVPVEGRIVDLKQILDGHPKVESVLLAIPSLGEERAREIARICNQSGKSIARARSFEEVVVHSADRTNSIISVEEILGRPIEEAFDPRVSQLISGQRVLVTGAGGSIGSELVRQVVQLGAERVILLDSSERNLFEIARELGPLGEGERCELCLGDIRDRERLNDIFARFGPNLVFHAAAYKHVALSEINVRETFLTNVLGTLNVLECATAFKCQRVVSISTDKAVDPVGVMGATKRVGEYLVRAWGARGGLSVSAVRFGNVINSTGSVIPIFREQILAGGPVTITHPDVERFFMSVQEAVKLVLHAATIAEPGAIFVLDMGVRLKIVEVARRMMVLLGRPETPLSYVGLRPGERIDEQLKGAHEKWHPTEYAQIGKLESSPWPSYDDLREWLGSLRESSGSATDSELRELILARCREIDGGMRS